MATMFLNLAIYYYNHGLLQLAAMYLQMSYDELEGQCWAEQYELDHAEEREHYAKLEKKYGDEAEYYINKYGLHYCS